MTSGEFTSVPVSSIWVDRAKRQRKTLVGIEELADSIRRTGLIHPPVIERSGELRTGERRFEAVKLLGWTSIPIQWVDEVDEAELQLLELEENVRRIDLPWNEQCMAVHTYHKLKLEQAADWKQTDTAEALGLHPNEVVDRIKVANEIVSGNTRVKDAPKYSTARNIVRRETERRAASAKKAITSAPATAEPTVPLINASFLDWVETATEEFNFLHCDFPYGINADQHHQGQAKEQGGYTDDFETYDNLVSALGRAVERGVIANSAHMIFWFSMDYYHWTKTKLETQGWAVLAHPLIWFKSDGTGIAPDPQRQPRRQYETAFFCSRGDRKLTARGTAANIFSHPGADKSIHMSEKPVPMLKHFMSMVVDEYSTVLDPTCGSGNAIKAAEALKAQRVLGIELSEEFYNRAKEAYNE